MRLIKFKVSKCHVYICFSPTLTVNEAAGFQYIADVLSIRVKDYKGSKGIQIKVLFFIYFSVYWIK